MNIPVIELGTVTLQHNITGLSRILAETVDDGAAISFMSPSADDDA